MRSDGLFTPIVERLGFDPSEDDSAYTRQLRTLSISQAAEAKGARRASIQSTPIFYQSSETFSRVVYELAGRFAQYMQSENGSNIPVNSKEVIYVTACVRDPVVVLR